MKKHIIGGILCLLSCALIAQNKTDERQTKGNPDDRPNFVFIVADDLGYGDLGFTGSIQIKTPNIDQLATTGIQCSEGYVSSAVCSPSRAGFLMGINQVSFGHDNNLAENQPGFDPQFLEGAQWKKRQLAQYDHTYPLTQPD